MRTGFYLWELAHREFPVSFTGFGFTVCLTSAIILRASLAKILFGVPVPKYLATKKSKILAQFLDNFGKFMYTPK